MAKTDFIGVKLNSYKVKVINAVKVMGHDDSLPYNANFEVTDLDGKTLVKGDAWNDGWGGPSNYEVSEGDEKTLQEVNAECKACIKDEYLIGGEKHVWEFSLTDVIDLLADLCIHSKANLNKTFTYKAVNDFLKSA